MRLTHSTHADYFKTLFKVTADTSTLAHLMEYHRARDGTIYWRYDFSLVIKFGAPELRAQLLWYENVSVLPCHQIGLRLTRSPGY